ncbi:Hypothetical protein PP7435_CHR2-1078 [Komagataella phaffii CBS 7435]|uniref:Nibrin second BRCT domain-containing protein n=2 Tax=Komagataella phaffii TaxID=460519 RepID=C4R013_KOMPG|nr:Hypothetical protein PAS_chr2-1_0227 [Komagataella phaffii GS115]AOA62369.1 GQ67_00256T0 [Komagataella phaffii]CAH2448662.1 Hypothetical protein BQ9382_C2-5795 [Komagataella phaffii CBS 7435]AOA66923.1 GQ68_01133T0 [Komagataella phaffii GS115]CAY68837.1 Hypothetical protein PAS_chr2-1_0227 [Komagataella phaffii GS115]CCA38755.1 Hypothetical protein PP7435_CHR2-1078 [Komagataella phaffii CBS 7435]
MWILIQDGQEHLLIPGKVYKLGRGSRTSEQSIIDFQCPQPYVSKLQLTISVDQPSSQEIQDPKHISRLLIQNVGQGKVHYSGKIYKAKKDPVDIPVDYNQESVTLELGNLTKEYISVRFKWVNTVLWYSRSDNEDRLDELFHLARSLDIRLVTNYVDNVTLFLQGSQHTSKLAKALIKAIPIVKFDYLKVLFERKGKLEDSFELPNVENYVPEATLRFNRGRYELFQGLYFLVSRKDSLFLDFVALAKGKLVVLDLEDPPEILSEKFGLKKLDPQKIICFKPSNEIEREDEHHKMKKLASYLGVKLVGNPQVMESILKVDSSMLLTKEPLNLDKKRQISEVSPPETNTTQPKRSRFKRREIKPLDAMELLSQQVLSQQHEKKPIESAQRGEEPSVATVKKESRFRRNRMKQIALEDMIDVSQPNILSTQHDDQEETQIEELNKPLGKATGQTTEVKLTTPIQEDQMVVETELPVKEHSIADGSGLVSQHEPKATPEPPSSLVSTTAQVSKAKKPKTYKYTDSQIDALNPNASSNNQQKLSSMIMQAKELKLKESIDDDIQELLEETTNDTREKLKIHSDETLFRKEKASVRSHVDKSPFHPEWKGRVNFKKFKRKDLQGSLISTKIYVPLVDCQIEKENEKEKVLTKELEFLNELNQPIQDLDSQFPDISGKHKGKRMFVAESDEESEMETEQFESRPRTKTRSSITSRNKPAEPDVIESDDDDDEPKFRFTTPS